MLYLKDTDGDGKADKSTVFVQDKDLIAPLGIAAQVLWLQHRSRPLVATLTTSGNA